MLTLTNYPNLDGTLIKFLKLLGVIVNSKDVTDELEKHPDNSSILAINEVLNWFKVDNTAYHVGSNALTDVPTPFIAHTNKNNDFVIVNKITADKITLSDHQRSNYRLPLNEFKKIYNGIVLTAEATGSAAILKQSWPDRLSPYKLPAALSGLAVTFITALFLFTDYYSNLNWQILSLTCFKTAGLITSVLLLVQSIDRNNPLVQTLCGGGGKTNCNAILTSKAATVFKGLTWSEVGFFYFAGTWLALLFGGGSASLLQVLALLNIVSLPYTIYSINYQARIAKQWCLFCTIVQGLLWLEFIPLFQYLKAPYHPFAKIEFIALAMITPVCLWLLLKPLLLERQELKTLKGQMQRLKYNKKLFDAALIQQPKYVLPAEEWSIVLGNAEASTIITMVSNPYCQPCSRTHRELEEWLNRLPDIQLRIVFNARNHENDVKTPISRHLMALNNQQDKPLIKIALSDWYEQKQKSYEEWAKAYPVVLDESKFEILDKQRAWCNIAEIKATPTLLINGYRLPEAYRLQDIKYMLA